MISTQKIILTILIFCFTILIKHIYIKYLNKNVHKDKLPYFAIIYSFLIVSYIYINHISIYERNKLQNTKKKDEMWYNEIINYLYIIFLSIAIYMTINKNKNVWSIISYLSIVSLLSLVIKIKYMLSE